MTKSDIGHAALLRRSDPQEDVPDLTERMHPPIRGGSRLGQEGDSMSESIRQIQQEVWDHLQQAQCVYLATAEADQPRVRPVTLLNINEKFWIATSPQTTATWSAPHGT